MKKQLAAAGNIENKIFFIRGKSVMVDRDLAALYGVTTGNLNLAVKRNIERFPKHYMFQLTKTEFDNLMLQNAISSWGGTRKLPYVFTEQGVAMLSSVLKSKRAIAINIQIIDTFIAMRQIVNSGRVDNRLEILERAVLSTDKRVDDILEVLNAMLETEDKKESKKIGFVP
ncbi:MAG: ORF6N domain-containing protein [Elusimicrobia bacterium]|nr:ORF6N domain-containing protein [Elusimicrobiota bacterium]